MTAFFPGRPLLIRLERAKSRQAVKEVRRSQIRMPKLPRFRANGRGR